MPTYEEAVKQAFDFYDRREFVQAEEVGDQLLGTTLKDPRTHMLLGGCHMAAKRFGHAIQFFRNAVSMLPEEPNCWDALGSALRNVGQDEAAREAYRRAIDLNPNVDHFHSNLGGTYVNTGRPAEGVPVLKRALELNPDNGMAANNLALCLLEMGNWREGFEYYKRRKYHSDWHNRDFGKVPEWDGTPTDKLVIHGEQGVGDEVMFLTCFEDVRKICPNVAVEVNPRLVGLMQNSLGVPCYPDYKSMLEREQPTAWVAMGDLPYYTRRDGQFTDGVYLKPEYTYPKGKKRRIGISWLGGTRSTHSYLRNFPINWWRPLLEVDADFISLQYGPYGKTEAAQIGIPHDQEWIDDLHRFAAMVASCDLVITVCNTTVHFAGALGVPCKVFTPYAPAWRYGLEGPMPWYKSVELYRQGQGEDWKDVVKRVRADL